MIDCVFLSVVKQINHDLYSIKLQGRSFDELRVNDGIFFTMVCSLNVSKNPYFEQQTRKK